MEIMNMNLMDGDKEPVELYISCRDLTNLEFIGKSDPQVKVFLQVQDKWMSVGKTEKAKNNLNPDFKKTVLVDFIFETRQPLRFDVYDHDDAGDQLIGNVETSMGEIMGARKQTITLDVQKGGKVTGKIIIRGDKIGGPRNDMVWQWKGLNIMNMGGCFGDKSSPQLKFFKEKGGSWLPIHETEAVKHDLNPIWKPFRISEAKLCGADHNQLIKIECWDKVKDGQPKYIGVCDITIEKLKGGQTSITLINENKNKMSGTLQVMEFGFQPPNPTFLDYIRGGEQLNLMVAIDFTLSNLRPNDPNSLHAWLPNGEMNDYQQAICTVCQILLNYDFDKFVPLYGFGADLKYPTLPPGDSDCFPCNGNPQQPHVPGLQGIMDAYNFALNNIQLSGPTIFGKVIAEAMKVAKANKENGSDIYTTLLILTDGRMNDIRQVVQLLVDAAKLPLSIIIVGLGDSDFSGMDMVSDKKKLEDQAERKVERDLVNFVLYKKYKNNMPELAKHLLAEIPKQLIKYKELNNQNPKPSLY